MIVMDAVGLRGLRRKRGAAAGATVPQHYGTCGYCSRERGRGPAARAVRGAGTSAAGFRPRSAREKVFFF
jgi:hypothetical protein